MENDQSKVIHPAQSDLLLLEVRELKVHFPVFGGIIPRVVGWVKAVDGVSFAVKQGETLGIVGESGCGKTTVGKAILRLVNLTSGHIEFLDPEQGRIDLASFTRRSMKPHRKNIQMIFQDPYSSLNPRMTIAKIVEEPLQVHWPEMKREEREEFVVDLLERVGLRGEQISRYPHEFSGGQRQRIGIARALATNPNLIIADEPVSALDVSIQAQVINLLEDLQEQFGLTYLFIAHNLALVKHIADRIAVMYLGEIVEIGPAEEVYYNPMHPYTRALLSAVPLPDPSHKRNERIRLGGEVPSPMNKPSGCPFRTRCSLAQERCAQEEPQLASHKGWRIEHQAACFFIDT